jgi:hypothetical protein
MTEPNNDQYKKQLNLVVTRLIIEKITFEKLYYSLYGDYSGNKYQAMKVIEHDPNLDFSTKIDLVNHYSEN